jgi:hypothetical protein
MAHGMNKQQGIGILTRYWVDMFLDGRVTLSGNRSEHTQRHVKSVGSAGVAVVFKTESVAQNASSCRVHFETEEQTNTSAR